jgi:peptidoglycan/xylan/chitin deacetylase (PgdA/CDA1 family)
VTSIPEADGWPWEAADNVADAEGVGVGRKAGLRILALVVSLTAAAFAAAPGTAGAAVQRVTAPAAAAAAGQLTAGAHRGGAGQGTPARTVVTFAWGGGYADQTEALPIFRSEGMHATYFIPSGLVCGQSHAACARSSPYLTVPDLRAITADGNEIGGLTVLHEQLTTLPPAEAQREICNDRSNLFRWGFRPTDFAYPLAIENPAVEAMIRKCGYNAGLGAGELRGGGRCLSCAWAETIPPANPLKVRAPIEVNSVGTRWSLRTYQSVVRGAQVHGGGWVIFTIHQVCAQTCAYGITPGELRSVLGWLHRQAGQGVAVQTMRQVIGGPVRKPVAGPAPRHIPAPGVVNAALSRKAGNGYPACFQPSDYGHNTAAFSYAPDGGPNGTAAETLQVTNWATGDAKLLPSLDLGACAPSVTAGRAYTVAARYKATLPTQFDLYYRTAVGSWQYWTTSPAFPASAFWAKASWTTPAVPAGATALSAGLAAESDGMISTSGYSVTPVTSYRPEVMLGLLVFALVSIGLITRGYVRYNRYMRAQAAAAAAPAVTAPPAAPAAGVGSAAPGQPASSGAGQRAGGGADQRDGGEPDQPPSAADRAGSAGMTAPGGQSGA